jgi:hypothetical protein
MGHRAILDVSDNRKKYFACTRIRTPARSACNMVTYRVHYPGSQDYKGRVKFVMIVYLLLSDAVCLM